MYLNVKRVNRLRKNKTKNSINFVTGKTDVKCKKDARDRLLRNRSGLLGYARFSPYDQRRGVKPFLLIFFLILTNVRVIKFFP